MRQAKQRARESKDRAERLSAAIRDREAKEHAGVADLERLDRDLGSLRDDLRAVGGERGALEAQVRSLSRQQRLTVAQARAANASLGEYLRAWAQGDPEGAAADVALWCGSAVADRLVAARLSHAELSQRQGRLAEHLTRLGRLRAVSGAKERQLAAKRRERNAFVARLRRENQDDRTRVRDAERTASEMDRLVKALATRERTAPLAASSSVPLPARAGQLVWPVRGPLLARFGRHRHPDFNATVNSAGVEIGATAGVAVAAALDGRVVYSDWLPGYGRVMIVDHGNGFYTVYGHLQEALVPNGGGVRRGMRLGTVGDSGSLGEPSLYFEVRSRGKPVDPMKYLS